MNVICMNNIIEWHFSSGICSGDTNIKKMISPLFEPLAESYREVFGMVVSQREFYGLRDFYRQGLDKFKIIYSKMFDESVDL